MIKSLLKTINLCLYRRGLFILILLSLIGHSQSYTVNSFQKINSSQGNFFGDLDNQDNLGVSIEGIGD
ncbi:hypothetical protein PK35_14060 [Tamlana nanhaiensis]|uniref:Uncharacterized protein n=1 Tax=Neotamlana nanhaiensis TaxID=1382798 RepID=A0A0D7VXC2_9FLAO|nr:hypothetical protein PK35_14060 [Tamlana nanhaiensis]